MTLLAEALAGAADIRDIRGPVEIPQPAPWLLYGAALLAVLAIGAVAFHFLRRRRADRRRPPWEIAFERLEGVRQLMEPGRARDFAYALSEVLRAYIEARYGLPTSPVTTEEFLQGLESSRVGPVAANREPLGRFLAQCDLGKFAKWQLGEPEMEALYGTARSFIEATREKEEGSPS
jgi:hypothetical protein